MKPFKPGSGTEQRDAHSPQKTGATLRKPPNSEAARAIAAVFEEGDEAEEGSR